MLYLVMCMFALVQICFLCLYFVNENAGIRIIDNTNANKFVKNMNGYFSVLFAFLSYCLILFYGLTFVIYCCELSFCAENKGIIAMLYVVN